MKQTTFARWRCRCADACPSLTFDSLFPGMFVAGFPFFFGDLFVAGIATCKQDATKMPGICFSPFFVSSNLPPSIQQPRSPPRHKEKRSNAFACAMTLEQTRRFPSNAKTGVIAGSSLLLMPPCAISRHALIIMESVSRVAAQWWCTHLPCLGVWSGQTGNACS